MISIQPIQLKTRYAWELVAHFEKYILNLGNLEYAWELVAGTQVFSLPRLGTLLSWYCTIPRDPCPLPRQEIMLKMLEMNETMRILHILIILEFHLINSSN